MGIKKQQMKIYETNNHLTMGLIRGITAEMETDLPVPGWERQFQEHTSLDNAIRDGISPSGGIKMRRKGEEKGGRDGGNN